MGRVGYTMYIRCICIGLLCTMYIRCNTSVVKLFMGHHKHAYVYLYIYIYIYI
jgi:hypothetical protein